MSEDTIYTVDDSDQAMADATRLARKSFKFFWRELSWEYRRIVPGLGVSAVKVAFPVPKRLLRRTPETEVMWISDIEFDGRTISGSLLNEPHWIRKMSAGDPVSIPKSELIDWMYSYQDRAFGGFTVNAMRAGMPAEERAQHDEAWGLDFGDPQTTFVAPAFQLEEDGSGRWDEEGRAMTAEEAESQEHPMSLNSTQSLAQTLTEQPQLISESDQDGWTLLHREALAGNLGPVQVLLEHGADRNLKNSQGQTPLSLAQRMGWPRVVEALESLPS